MIAVPGNAAFSKQVIAMRIPVVLLEITTDCFQNTNNDGYSSSFNVP